MKGEHVIVWEICTDALNAAPLTVYALHSSCTHTDRVPLLLRNHPPLHIQRIFILRYVM